ncbi:hypothetical protein PTSG_07272 [Salpingoeca rosetta]|uniref:EF hand family protein n=1 Tax=Salpingoeca rosetta (strain ATCC 50818 / BSB-021) TaxID=946362 RepID=F2UIY3_SALR5|nr:uncharacterized protein PTSG_07272 [Salpingoeca rosetta]EGD76931.1 hypothetical protein PTSG_07272 [Salpingoeca rosetta]|eukprot:XP_004990771.1 hypothetical protein PTSG_07272 [Salpingoeca rosetta]
MTEAVQAVQAAIALRRVRVDEHFRDFDPLRAGRITPSQFLRCLDQVGVRLSEEQRETLLKQYDTGDGRVNYRQFVQDVYSAFTRTNLEKAPAEKPPTPDRAETSLIGAAARFGYDDPEMEDLYFELRDIIRKHCKTYGMSVRSAFQEFDKVNRGIVTPAQFERNLPAPKDIEPFHVRVIANRFLQDNNMVNYLAFHRDVEGIGPEQPLGFRNTLRKREMEDVPGAGTIRAASADDVLRELQVAFHKTRVRPVEFMRDYDKLNSSCITANQFECGLSLACSAPGGVRLTREQVNALVERFRAPDGRVNYRQFCKQVDEAFVTGKDDDLVRDPLASVPTRTRKDIVRDENELAGEDEERVQLVLAAIKQHVDERNLDLYPQFRDFDRRHGFTKGVTRAQFRRLLDLTLGLPLQERDVELVCDKYTNAATGHVNYHKFIADVDEDSNLKPQEQLYFDKASIANFKTMKDVDAEREERMADLDEAIAMLKLRVVERSLRAAEYLRDFDRLRKGLITAAQFKTGVKAMHPDMSEDHLNALTAAYTDTTAAPPAVIAWRRFASDMDDLLLPTRNLEKAPTTCGD